MAENLNYIPQTGNSWYYGTRLYDWETALTACPSGWHLPSRDEWNSLALAVGGSYRNLKAEIGWDTRFPVDWTDEYGFSAMPNGHRKLGGDFSPIYV